MVKELKLKKNKIARKREDQHSLITGQSLKFISF